MRAGRLDDRGCPDVGIAQRRSPRRLTILIRVRTEAGVQQVDVAGVICVRQVRDDAPVTLSFPVSDGVLLATQASLVALPRALPPAQLRALAGRSWALVPAGSIALVIAAIAIAPGTADFLTYLALVATPLLAAVALAVIVPGARWWLAPLVVPLLAVAWKA